MSSHRPNHSIDSIRDQLKKISQRTNREFQSILLQYAQERFLYRVSCSRYNDNFILKGALLLLIKSVSRLRPTKDIDFLGTSIPNNNKNIERIIQEIIEIHIDDGVTFDSVKAKEITEDAEYHGNRVKFNAKLGTIKIRMQLDIGFGDIVIPKASKINFPTLLDFPAPNLFVYSLDSVIAEKFEVIVSLSLINSRMKDFYDIYFIASHFPFEKNILTKAVRSTFNHRGTDLSHRAIIFTETFALEKQKEWISFIKRNPLDIDVNFGKIVGHIKTFIEPVFNKDSYTRWNPEVFSWE